MPRLIDHGFAAYQRWSNAAGFVLYVLSVNDDYVDNGELKPGKICVTETKPFPGKKLQATDLHPNNMLEVITKGGYTPMDEGWDVDFKAAQKAIDDARAQAGETAPAPIKPAPTSGIGLALIK